MEKICYCDRMGEVEDAPIRVELANLGRCYFRVSRALYDMLGYREEELLGKTSNEITHPDDLGNSAQSAHQMVEEEVPGGPSHFVCLHQDITAHKEVEELKKSEQRYRTLVEFSPEPIVVHNGEELLYVNPAGAKLFGVEVVELIGRDVLEFVHPDDRAEVASRIRDALHKGERLPLAESRFLRPDGSILHLETVGQPIIYGGKPAMQSALRNVTRRRASEEQLLHQATHDPLTGLPNRRLFDDRFEHALERARRTEEMVALLYVDLDGFKHVNDRYGHDIGDALLKAVAQRLRDCLRSADTIARLGGDEFAVVLEGESAAQAPKIAGRLLEVMRDPFDVAGRRLEVSASAGAVSQASRELESGVQLLREAGMTMYRAKQEGKDRYELSRYGLSRCDLTA